jgi:uncharacterized protein (UPF0276 family)
MTQFEKIVDLCREEGLEIMGEVADVVINRENVDPVDVRRYLEDVGVEGAYESFIGPAIDRIEDAIRAYERGEALPNVR